MNEELARAMEQAITCGYCGGVTTVGSGHDCKVCGRVLCPGCGERWGFCKDHVPVCSHSELVPTQWDQPKPEPCKMVGRSQYNMICPVCGYGWGCAPDPCDDPEDQFLVSSGTLTYLVSEALQVSPSVDWERELEEM